MSPPVSGILNAIVDAYSTNLLRHKCGEKARQYLKKRHINYKMFCLENGFKIGTPNGLRDIRLLEKIGLTIRDFQNIGLFNGGVPYFERGRVLFPVWHKEKCVHVTSRAIYDDNKRPHKHMHKNIWYMYNNTVLDTVDLTALYVVEGPIDCLSMIQMGIPNTIASYGTGGLRKSITDNLDKEATVYFVYDNDANGSGKKGAYRCAWKMAEWGYTNTFIVDLYKTSKENKVDCNDILVKHHPTTSDQFWKYIQSLSRYSATEDYETRSRRKVKQKLNQIKHMYDEGIHNTTDKEVLKTIPIRYVISRISGVEIPEYSTMCPLPNHNETNPSFHIYPENNSFHCFGCQRGGDVISFVRYYYGVGYYKALEILRKIAKEETQCQKY